MFRKNYLISFLTIVLFLVGGITVFAQNAPVRGLVELKVDGKATPVAGALVEVFRTDIKGKFPADTTDKKGAFNFAGLPLGAVFVLSISGPGIGPEIIPNVKAGMESLVINVLPGDGKKWTEEEVRQAVANPTGNQNTEESADAKKKREEIEKKNAEIIAKNNKIKETDEVARKSLEEGDKAFKAKSYDVALARFDEGITAVPDYVGSTPVLLNYKGVTLKDRGFGFYLEGSKDKAVKDAKFEAAKKDWNDALDAFNRGLEIIKTAAAATDPNDQKNRDATKANLLSNAAEVHRLMVQSGVDTTRTKDAITIYDEYLPLETDPARKIKSKVAYADILREGGDADNAIIQYRKALELAPDNPDVLAGLGLSLFNAGAISNNKEQMQEGLNFLERFTAVAPDTHRLKASVKDAVEYLKTEQKLTPQKTTTKPTTTKKKT
jgi:tetratricopeptide (TPR) repeat protein